MDANSQATFSPFCVKNTPNEFYGTSAVELDLEADIPLKSEL